MGNPLRERRSPQEFAANRQVIEFTDKLASFERLSAIVEADLNALEAAERPANWRNRAVSGHLSFGFADAQGGLPALTGTVVATLDAVCQRCLAAMTLPVEVELRLLFAAGAGSATAAGGYDVWELDDDGQLQPQALVEEALIMALPLAPKHRAGSGCVEVGKAAPLAAKTVRPFAALRAQMDKED